MDLFTIVLVILLLSQPVIIFMLIKKNKSLKKELADLKVTHEFVLKKYKPVSDIQKVVKDKEQLLTDYELNMNNLKDKYKLGLERYKQLEYDISLYEEVNELIEHGSYIPYFDFETSEKFKSAIKENKEKQKIFIKNKTAAICKTQWTVGDSRREGEIMTNKAIKLTLRAFNGECDALISKVKWNNIQNIEGRMIKSFETINKANESNQIVIQQVYLDLKVNEARLTHEYNLKKHEEKEEQRAIKEQMREEERANREIEKAKRDAEIEERRYEKALKQAQSELLKAEGGKLDKLNDKIAKLQEALDQAHVMKERAISRAQVTKSGHVYIISNIGSFGENVYKIGMTRRLEPLDRVKELGDASVPFQFDIHAMIYSDNAPSLEAELHRKFNAKRINKINHRKEYFDVTIDEIEKSLNDIAGAEIEVMKIAEAHEYRESLSILLAEKKKMNETKIIEPVASKRYSDDLFN